MRIATVVVGVLVLWHCTFIVSGQFVLFDNGLNPFVSLQSSAPDRLICKVSSSGGYPSGDKSIRMSTKTFTSPGDTCALFFKFPTNSSFTELEFFARAKPSSQLVQVEVKDTHGNSSGIDTVIPTTYTRFRFPLPNGFENGVDFTSLISPFGLATTVQVGQRITVDNVVLRTLPFFAIFSDDTTHGREQLFSWGGECKIKTEVGAPVGERLLKVPKNVWGCGFFFYNPNLNLSGFTHLEFNLKSKVQTKIEIESNVLNKKTAVFVNSTNGAWETIRIPLADFGFENLDTIDGPFLITKVGNNSDNTYVNFIRYSAVVTPPTPNPGYTFDGSSCIVIPNELLLSLDSYFTIEFLVKSTQSTNGSFEASMFEKWNTTEQRFPAALRLETESGNVLFLDLNLVDQPFFSDQLLSSTVINDGNRHHVIAVRQNRTLTLYVDGVEQVSVTDETADPTLAVNESPIFLGCRGTPKEGNFTNFFEGNLAGVRVWDLALSNFTILDLANYAIEFGVEKPLSDLSGLVGYWPLTPESIVGDVVLDSSPWKYNGTLFSS